MHSFSQRSYQKELLDREDIPFAAIKRNMQELDFINRKLGGHAITLKGIVTILKRARPTTGSFKITEIGCGGGDNLRAIKEWAGKSGLLVELTGVDRNPECVVYANRSKGNEGIHFIHSDYRESSFEKMPDIIFSSLFCHHFTDEELVNMLRWMRDNSQLGFFINDLHRHPLAFYSIKLLTRLFSQSYLVKNDAPLSVKRGFKREEWENLFAAAGISNFDCQWQWAFRWLITSFNADRKAI